MTRDDAIKLANCWAVDVDDRLLYWISRDDAIRSFVLILPAAMRCDPAQTVTVGAYTAWRDRIGMQHYRILFEEVVLVREWCEKTAPELLCDEGSQDEWT